MIPEPVVPDVHDRTCPTCGSPVTGLRTFCKLSCRIAHDRQQTRTPPLFPPADVLVTELPSENEVRAARETRQRIARLYSRPRSAPEPRRGKAR